MWKCWDKVRNLFFLVWFEGAYGDLNLGYDLVGGGRWVYGGMRGWCILGGDSGVGKRTSEEVDGDAIENAKLSPAVGESRAASTAAVELLEAEGSRAIIVVDES